MTVSIRRGARAAAAGLGCTLILAAPAAAQLPPILQPSATPTPPPGPAVVDAQPADDSVTTVDGNAHHSRATASGLQGPLGVAWTASAPAPKGLLAVPGTLVAVDHSALIALDPATGARRWTASLSSIAGAAIVGDAIVVSTSSGLFGLALADGKRRWTVGAESAPTWGVTPVPAGDLVLLQDGGALRAYDAGTGAARYSAAVRDAGTPAVVGDRVYAPLCGGGFVVLDRRAGRELYRSERQCSSSGSAGVARAVGRTVISGPVAFDASSYASAPFASWKAARPGLALSGGDGQVVGYDSATGAQRWRIPSPLGSSSVWLAGTTGVLIGGTGVGLVDGTTGKTTWTARFRTPANGYDTSIAALGSVFVVHGGTLIALRPGADAMAPNLRATIRRSRVIQYGTRVPIRGSARDRILLVKRAVRLTERAVGRRTRTYTATSTGVRTGGTFAFNLTPDRFTRYTLRVAGAKGSKSFNVVVAHRERIRYSRGRTDPNAITARVRLRVPPGVPLAGRTYALYVGRAVAKRYVRIASGRVRGTGGKGRGTVTLRFRALRFGRRDFMRACITGVSARGLNFHDRLDRSCGAPGVRF